MSGTIPLLAIAVLLTSAVQTQTNTTLQQLTVPAERLPAGCTLSPAPAQSIDGQHVRGGLWAGLPISRNPWVGTDRQILASIRERVDPPSELPDGPPLSRAELARARLRLADGVEAGYAAVYLDALDRVIVVYGLKFSGRMTPVTTVAGPESACRAAIVAHVQPSQ